MNKMNESNSLIAEKDITFFGENEYLRNDVSLGQNSFTKNSSNAEKYYRE